MFASKSPGYHQYLAENTNCKTRELQIVGSEAHRGIENRYYSHIGDVLLSAYTSAARRNAVLAASVKECRL